jgi:type IV fimbrial biogenesis protein FimT
MHIRIRGVTLIELLVAMALAAILIGVAGPSLGALIDRSRVSNLNNALLGSLHLARTTAVMTGHNAVVCKSDNGTACTTEGDWNQGWMVFEDLDGLGTCDDENGDGRCGDGDNPRGRILRYVEAPAAGPMRLVNNQNVKDRVRYFPMGTSPGSNGRFTICDTRTHEPRAGFVVSNSGRVRAAKTAADFLACD